MVNVGTTDRVVRFLLGIALLLAPFVPPLAAVVADWGAWKFALPAAGLVLIATAVVRVCPAYLLFGIRTCRAGKR